MQVAVCHYAGLAAVSRQRQKIRFVAREKPDARPDSKNLQLSVTFGIYGDKERYDYFAGQGHHVSPFYFWYPRVNLIAQSSGEPVRAEESFADGGRAIGCKLFKIIQAKPLPVDAAAEAPLGDPSFDQPQAPLSRTFCNELCPGERLSKGINDEPPPSSFWLTDMRVKLARPATSGLSRLEDRLGHFNRGCPRRLTLEIVTSARHAWRRGCKCDARRGSRSSQVVFSIGWPELMGILGPLNVSKASSPMGWMEHGAPTFRTGAVLPLGWPTHDSLMETIIAKQATGDADHCIVWLVKVTTKSPANCQRRTLQNCVPRVGVMTRAYGPFAARFG
jgi:hypothetical protein